MVVIYHIIINASYAFIKSTCITIVSTKVLSTIFIKYAIWAHFTPNAIEVPIVPIKVSKL